MTRHILIVGSGELAPKLTQSPRVGKVSIANSTVAIAETDIDELLGWAAEYKPDLTLINSPAALAAGIVDAFQAAGQRVFGPTKAAAQIGVSSVFAKHFMEHHAIPTAPFAVFDTFRKAIGYLLTEGDQKLTIQADGPTDGIPYYMTDCSHDAEAAVRDLMVNRALAPIVIEPQSDGKVVRLAAFSDGTHVQTLGAAPSNTLLQATLDGLRADGSPFVGMLGAKWVPDESRVLSYQVGLDNTLLSGLTTDLLDIFDACLNGTLDQLKIE